jgi:hypothetical protein
MLGRRAAAALALSHRRERAREVVLLVPQASLQFTVVRVLGEGQVGYHSSQPVGGQVPAKRMSERG